MSDHLNLPPLIAMAQHVAHEANGKGASRRPSFAPPIPFDDPKEGAGVGARLWAAFTSPKGRDGARLQKFRIRLGKASNGKDVATLWPISGRPGVLRLSVPMAILPLRSTASNSKTGIRRLRGASPAGSPRRW